jgi:hypothetical protein
VFLKIETEKAILQYCTENDFTRIVTIEIDPFIYAFQSTHKPKNCKAMNDASLYQFPICRRDLLFLEKKRAKLERPP